MKYNIGFTLGDPVWGGHAYTTDYHIVANHSADEISKAYKIRRQMDYAEMINMMTKQLKGIYANSPRKSYENLDSSFFEWEVETNFINK